MLAAADMRPNLAIATLLLVAGVIYVLFLARRNPGGAKSARWVPWASLAAGPLCGLLYSIAHFWLISPGGWTASDVSSLLGAALFIGTFAGCIAALVFGAALHLRYRRDG